MNWDIVSAIAEILGSLTVIASIFYLAIQVKHAASVAEASTQQTAAQMSFDSIAVTLDSQVLSSASRKATSGEELTPDETSNYLRWVWARMRVAENAHYQFRQGLLDAEAWLAYSVMIFAHVGQGSIAEDHWGRVSLTYTDSFRQEVERVLEWAENTGQYDLDTEFREEHRAMLKKELLK